MVSHAHKCPYVPQSDFDAVSAIEKQQKNSENVPPLVPAPIPCPTTAPNPSPRSLKRARSDTTNFMLDSCRCNETWDVHRQEMFGRDICDLFLACSWSWNAADNPALQMFFSKWLPGCVVPSRRRLSGGYLDEAAKRAEGEVQVRVKGKMTTGQSDGWKNVAKTNVVTSMMTVERTVSLFGAFLSITF